MPPIISPSWTQSASDPPQSFWQLQWSSPFPHIPSPHFAHTIKPPGETVQPPAAFAARPLIFDNPGQQFGRSFKE
jgi:hypothetical protein